MRGLLLAATAATAAAHWRIIAPSVGTICTGSAFTYSGSGNATGYIAVAQNGVGTGIQKSVDGGYTWGPSAPEPFALLLLDIAAYGENVAVIGALEMEYSVNGGASFNSSLNQPGAGQCIRPVGPFGSEVGFGAVGQWGLLSESNGVEVSFDGGAIFKTVNVSSLVASSRYGAFPGDKTWFISAGDWPGEGSDDDAPAADDDPPALRTRGWRVNPGHYYGAVPSNTNLLTAKSASLHLLQKPDGGLMYAVVRPEAKVLANAGPLRAAKGGLTDNSTWIAQIAVTTDGGDSWSTPFTRVGQFYLNGIECQSESACCAVGESGAGGPTGGSYIWCTTDGGNTWNENLIDSDPNSSLMDIAYLNATSIWAVGGEFGSFGPSRTHFYVSNDAGSTWTEDSGDDVIDQYAISIDCVPSDANCWATTLDLLTQESSIAALN